MLRLYRFVFRAAAAVAMILALLPSPPVTVQSDKLLHMLAFAILAALAFAAFPARSLLALLAGLSAFGALIEAMQAIPALNRQSEVMDWVADTVAAALVLALAGWLRTRLARR